MTDTCLVNPIGCHLTPGASKVLEALTRCHQLQLTALQVFSGGRISRKVFSPPEEQWTEINKLTKDLYCSIHAAYVINMCTPPSSTAAARSRQHLIESLRWAERLGFDVVLFHPGSALDRPPEKGREYLVANTTKVLDSYTGPVKLLFENSAGDKRDRVVGRDLLELNQLAVDCGPAERIGLCVDTVHAWSAGYSLSEIPKVATACNRLEMIHFNVPLPGITCGSRKDRHGTFATTDWSSKEIMTLARGLNRWPLIMETADISDPHSLQKYLEVPVQ